MIGIADGSRKDLGLITLDGINIGDLLNQPIYLGSLPIATATVQFLIIYAIILGVLVYVTGRLARSPRQAPLTSPPKGEANATIPQQVAGGTQ